MRVLVTGASGFIGAHVVGALLGAGHEVTGCARDVEWARRRCPQAQWIVCDFNRDLSPEVWCPRLQGIDAVVNCAGVLRGSARQSIERIHRQAPMALYDACLAAGVARVVQLSALGIEADAGTEYAATKRAGDEYLMGLALDWVIVRPSLVYAGGSYGGTSALRGLAGFACVIPLPGGGCEQSFQPIHMDDLAAGIARLIEPDAPKRKTLEAAGPDTLNLREIVLALRGWLGFRPAPVAPVPMALIRLAGRLGDALYWISGRGTLNSTSVRQMRHGSLAEPGGEARRGFEKALGYAPKSMASALAQNPSQVQDRWHARLYFARPVLRLTLALFWIASGLVVAFADARSQAEAILSAVGFGSAFLPALIWAGAVADVSLGVLLLARWRVRLVGGAMLAMSAFYGVVISYGAPEIWLDPLGAMLKIAPLMAATMVMMAIENDR
ncbi:MAG: NAD(P)H-binding protein [Alphaproteobacteria bacterium]